MKKSRVLIVDDSSVMRSLLHRLLTQDPEIEVVGTAQDPYVAREKILEARPDVLTLDLEMPRMDGLTFLEKLMKHHPIPVIVISSLAKENSPTALKALELGACEVIMKPDVSNLSDLGQELCRKVKALRFARLPKANSESAKKRIGDTSPPQRLSLARTTHQVLAVAASTGGTEALKVFLGALPADVPATLVVQHLPSNFVEAFVRSLIPLCSANVSVATHGDRILPGQIKIAPGNRHLELARNGAYFTTLLHDKALRHGVRPAADYLFESVARQAPASSVGVVLTGMGKDGAEGLLKMREAGAPTFGQDEQSCVVYGMPKAAKEIGAILREGPLVKLSLWALEALQSQSKT